MTGGVAQVVGPDFKLQYGNINIFQLKKKQGLILCSGGL
jgi:hypothetical protein